VAVRTIAGQTRKKGWTEVGKKREGESRNIKCLEPQGLGKGFFSPVGKALRIWLKNNSLPGNHDSSIPGLNWNRRAKVPLQPVYRSSFRKTSHELRKRLICSTQCHRTTFSLPLPPSQKECESHLSGEQKNAAVFTNRISWRKITIASLKEINAVTFLTNLTTIPARPTKPGPTYNSGPKRPWPPPETNLLRFFAGSLVLYINFSCSKINGRNSRVQVTTSRKSLVFSHWSALDVNVTFRDSDAETCESMKLWWTSVFNASIAASPSTQHYGTRPSQCFGSFEVMWQFIQSWCDSLSWDGCMRLVQ